MKTGRTIKLGKPKTVGGTKKAGIVIPFKPTHSDYEEEKLSIETCRSILCRKGATYTDEEIPLIRQTLYNLAEIDLKYHLELKKQTPNPIQPETNDQQKSYPLHPGIDRRAS